jgi:hypothetical protein
VDYEDGGVVCNDDEMVVKNYTAWLGSKHIKYEQITSAERLDAAAPLGPVVRGSFADDEASRDPRLKDADR